MKITVAGVGYVGLVTGVCMAEKGHQVVCIDTDKDKIEILENGKSPFYENGLDNMLSMNIDRLSFTTDYHTAYKNADVIFIAVGTPEKKDGSANLSFVYEVAQQIAETAEKECIVAIKSTVPVGTNDKIEKIIDNCKKRDINIDVVSNPEFLAQGSAIRDTLHAKRIVIGIENERSERIMREIYKDYDVPILVMDRRSAEMVKYASNDFLALKLSYINEIANLCEIVGANIDCVAKGMGYDDRIGNKFLKAGIGYGGSCFPKDTKALHWLSNMNDYEIKTIKAAIEVNEQQKLKLIKKARKYYDSFEGLTIAVLGLTFKPGTDDLREAPSLVNVPILLEDGAIVKVWDPISKDKFYNILEKNGIHGLDKLVLCNSIAEAIQDADLCFILTEWDEIRNVDCSIYKSLMKNAIVIDGRNCYETYELINKGIRYESIGRK